MCKIVAEAKESSEVNNSDPEWERLQLPKSPSIANYSYPIPEMTDFYKQQSIIEAGFSTDLFVRFSYFILFVFASLREFLQDYGLKKRMGPAELSKHKGFVPIIGGKEGLFIRNLYRMGSDVVNHVISGLPGTVVNVKERVTDDFGWSYQFTGRNLLSTNLGSYNYLGFAENSGEVPELAASFIDKYGLYLGTSRSGSVIQKIIPELETRIAKYLGVEEAMVCSMGFGTNSMNIPAFIDEKGLILSDSLNHASIVLGCRLSGAKIIVFNHNDPVDLEAKLSKALVSSLLLETPFSKILIVCEGIYSMEGTICDLPAILRIKKKYKAYLFVDEAHSIGALGKNGRGVTDYFDINPNEVDILMGTLTKSFAGAGGFIAGKSNLIKYLKTKSHDHFYGSTMSPPVAGQIIGALDCLDEDIDGETEAQIRTKKLIENTHYFRKLLRDSGFLIYGHEDSPVVPCMVFYCTKGIHFLRQCLQRGIALVGVCYPAVPMTKVRIRFCLSAAHTREQLEEATNVCNQVAEQVRCKYGI